MKQKDKLKGKLKDKSFDIIQSEKQNTKEKALRDLQKTNIYMKEKEDKKRVKKKKSLFKENMAKNLKI